MSNVAYEQRSNRAAVKEFVASSQTWFGNKAISDAVKQKAHRLGIPNVKPGHPSKYKRKD